MPLLEASELGPSDSPPQQAHAAMLAALVNGEGFARVAAIAEEAVGSPVGIFVPRPGNDNLAETAAERFVVELVAGEETEPPAEVGEVVPIVSGATTQGAVLLFGEPRADATPFLRAAALAGLAGIAVLNALDDVGVPREQSLLHDLLTRADLSDSEIQRRARMQGCDLRGGSVALCIDPAASEPGKLVAMIVSERPEALVEQLRGKIYALLPGATPEQARHLTERLAEHSRPALSSSHRGAAGARLALEEAGVLLEMATAGNHDRADETNWDPIRILFRAYRADPEEVLRFAEHTIGPLVRQDAEHGSELQLTFWAYQRSNCNMNLTAKAIYTHRHTVSNRLARIEELTGLNPINGREREHLSLALKAHYVSTMGPSPS